MSLFIKTLTLSNNFVFWLVFFLLYRNGNFDSAMNSRYLYADSYTNSMDSIPPKDSAMIDLSGIQSYAVINNERDTLKILSHHTAGKVYYVTGTKITNPNKIKATERKHKRKTTPPK